MILAIFPQIYVKMIHISASYHYVSIYTEVYRLKWGRKDKSMLLICFLGLPGSSLTGGVGLTADLLFVAFAQIPRPSSRACRGFVSPGWCWQLSPEPHLPVYTPQGWPKLRAQVMQQPQPGSRTFSAQSLGKGLHKSRAPTSHGSHLITGAAAPDLPLSETRTKAVQSARRRESMVVNVKKRALALGSFSLIHIKPPDKASQYIDTSWL